MGGQSKVLTIRKPWPPNSLLPFQLPKPASVGSGRRPWRMGAGSAPPGRETTARTVGNPSSTPAARSLPVSAALERKASLSESRGMSDLSADSFSKDLSGTAGPWRRRRGRRGEGPNHSMRRRKPRPCSWQPARPCCPPCLPKWGTCPWEVNSPLW